jgi:hypothetical protein
MLHRQHDSRHHTRKMAAAAALTILGLALGTAHAIAAPASDAVEARWLGVVEGVDVPLRLDGVDIGSQRVGMAGFDVAGQSASSYCIDFRNDLISTEARTDPAPSPSAPRPPSHGPRAHSPLVTRHGRPPSSPPGRASLR